MTDPIYGTVHLTDWIGSPRGKVIGVTGEILVTSDEDHVGFRARGHNSANWIAVVTGETEKWHIFGCQVRAIVEHPRNAPEIADCWSVA